MVRANISTSIRQIINNGNSINNISFQLQNAIQQQETRFDLQIQMKEGNNYIYLIYDAHYNNSFIDRKKTIEYLNSIDAEKHNSRVTTLPFNTIHFTTGMDSVITEIITTLIGDGNTSKSSVINTGNSIIMNYFIKEIISNPGSLKTKPSLIKFTTILQSFIQKKTALIISYGQLTSKMEHLMIRYRNQHNNLNDMIQNSSYLFNFGPSFADIMTKSFNMMYNIAFNNKVKYKTIAEFNAIKNNFNQITIYFIVEEFSSTAEELYRYLSTYTSGFKRSVFISLNNKLQYSQFSIQNINNYQTSFTSTYYQNYLSQVANNTKTYNYARTNEESTGFYYPINIQIFEVPKTTTLSDQNTYKTGKNIKAGIDLAIKTFHINKSLIQPDKFFIYIFGSAISSHDSALAFSSAINNTKSIFNGTDVGEDDDACAKYFLKNGKIIISQPHDFDYMRSFKIISQNDKSIFANIKIITLFDITTSTINSIAESITGTSNVENLDMATNNTRNFIKKNQTVSLNYDNNTFSPYQFAKAIIDFTLIKYAEVIHIKKNNNFSYKSNNESINFTGEDFNKIYYSFFHLMLTNKLFCGTNLLKLIIAKLLINFNNIINMDDNLDSRYNIFILYNRTRGLGNVITDGFTKHYRIKEVLSYKFNSNFDIINYNIDSGENINDTIEYQYNSDVYAHLNSSSYAEIIMLNNEVRLTNNIEYTMTDKIIDLQSTIKIRSTTISEILSNQTVSAKIYDFDNISQVIINGAINNTEKSDITFNSLSTIKVIKLNASLTGKFKIIINHYVENIYNTSETFDIPSNFSTLTIE